ncbi:MAG: hypothetical protein GTO24_21225 [candidate division Zixibacteria bacterium]|nr:hypothetical protein [candidate division Zixibacteria bacterium]
MNNKLEKAIASRKKYEWAIAGFLLGMLFAACIATLKPSTFIVGVDVDQFAIQENTLGWIITAFFAMVGGFAGLFLFVSWLIEYGKTEVLKPDPPEEETDA